MIRSKYALKNGIIPLISLENSLIESSMKLSPEHFKIMQQLTYHNVIWR